MKNFLKNIKKFIYKIYDGRFTNILKTNENIIFATNKKRNEVITFPFKDKISADSSQFKILSFGYQEHMLNKYELVEGSIDNETTVIDCGGFIGGFTIAALLKRKAKRSIYVEPSYLNRKCGLINFSIYGIQNKVSVVEGGLGSKNEIRELNLAKSGTNNSFLNPDEDSIGISNSVNVYTLDKIIEKYKIHKSKIFLKLEAEGFEVEILKGLVKERIDMISVDISPEMDGESPLKIITEILLAKSYELKNLTKRVAFFTLVD